MRITRQIVLTLDKISSRIYMSVSFTFIKGFFERKYSSMEDLLIKIGELVATEIDDVNEIVYLDKEMGYMFYICLKNGKKLLLSLS